jgi:hypothetical protein
LTSKLGMFSLSQSVGILFFTRDKRFCWDASLTKSPTLLLMKMWPRMWRFDPTQCSALWRVVFRWFEGLFNYYRKSKRFIANWRLFLCKLFIAIHLCSSFRWSHWQVVLMGF